MKKIGMVTGGPVPKVEPYICTTLSDGRLVCEKIQPKETGHCSSMGLAFILLVPILFFVLIVFMMGFNSKKPKVLK